MILRKREGRVRKHQKKRHGPKNYAGREHGVKGVSKAARKKAGKNGIEYRRRAVEALRRAEEL